MGVEIIFIFHFIIFHVSTFYYQSTNFMCSILVGKVKDENILTMKISQSTVCNKREDQNTQKQP